MKNFTRPASKKGFTLVEMLVVIAIIAILVSVLIPTVMGAVKKAQAATDAANLRSVLSVLNIYFLDGNKNYAEAAASAMPYECKSFKGAESYAAFGDDNYIMVYFVKDNKAYSIDYFSEVANSGESTLIESFRDLSAKYEVRKLGQGEN